MSNTEDGMAMEELMTRLSELERATAHMSEELALLREARTIGNGQEQVNTRATPLASAKPKKSRHHNSRRRLLKKGLGMAVATLGAAAAFEMSGGNALANGVESSTTFNNNGGSSPAVTANSTSPASSKVNAIIATSTGYSGIAGYTNQNSNSASGVSGQGPYIGVSGQVNGANMLPNVKVGVFGTAGHQTSPYVGGIGILGSSDTYYGVSGTSTGGGSTTDSAGVAGSTTSTSPNDAGVKGVGPNGIIGLTNKATKDGIQGNTGVFGSGSSNNGSSLLYGTGVFGVSDGGDGVVGAAFLGGVGVWGQGSGGAGYGYGMEAIGDYFGIYAESDSGTAIFAYSRSSQSAGVFDGNVTVNGTLSKSSGSFKIDHPLDPANKYLFHSFVESPDMKNVYDGVVTLDAQGEAVVTLPNWFDALNTDFRYQLTAVGASAPNLHIASEISTQSFKIAGGTAGLKVCWQLTGNRQDPWAKAHPIPVEQDKTSSEKGHYLHPELYGHASDPNILEASHAAAKRWHELHSNRPKK